MQRLVRHHALEPAVLVLQGLQPLQLGLGHPTVLPFPAVEGVERDPVPPDHFLGGDAPLVLQQDGDDLLIRVLPFPLHGSTWPKAGQDPPMLAGPVSGGKVKPVALNHGDARKWPSADQRPSIRISGEIRRIT